MQMRTGLLLGILLSTPTMIHAQSSAPTSASTQEAPTSQGSAPKEKAPAPPEEKRRSEKYKQYLMLVSSWSGSGIFQVQPADPTLLAPLGGSVFNDTTLLGTSDSKKGFAVGLGFQVGGSLSLNFEKQTALDAYLGVGPGLKLGRLVLGVFGGGGVDGIGLFNDNPELFQLPTAAYGYVNGRGNIFLTERLAAEVSTSFLARVGAVDELRIVGRLIRLRSTEFDPEQEGSAFGFAYTDYDGAAESFSILWSLSR